MKKVLSFAVMLVILCGCLTVCVYATKDKILVVDNADLLTDDEESSLNAELNELVREHDMDFVVLTTPSLDGFTPQGFAEDYYVRYDYGQGAEHSGVILLYCPATRDWYLSTNGDAIGVFDSNTIETIGDAFTPYIKEGNYYQGFLTFARECDVACTHAPLAWYWIIVALLIGLLIAWLIVASMKSALNSVRSKAQADDYMRRDSMHLSVSRDIFLFRHITRRPKPKDNGGSVVHRGASGRMHGGGGGKC